MLKPDMRMIWANSGDVVTPPESKIDLGWILEKPPSQYFNWHLNRTDRMLNHINRRGIPSWSSDTEYHTDGIASYVVGSNGRVYVSVAPSGNNTSPAKDPTTDTTREFWKPAFVGWDEAIPESQITGLTTKLNSKVDKTQRVNTSNGLSGGGALSGDLTIRPTYGTTANTVTQGNDPRLSNSREWSAATVGEAEAKAGTATTRRAWTAQRVHQAADGWYDKKFSTIVKNILSRSNAQQIRNDLQLGTAATRNVGTSDGEVLVVGNSFGLGEYNQATSYPTEIDNLTEEEFKELGNGFYKSHLYDPNTHPLAPYDTKNLLTDYLSIIKTKRDSNGGFSLLGGGTGRLLFLPQYSGGQLHPIQEILHTGNILSTTGNSSSYPMTQAATTAALNQKVSNTTSIIAGTGLEGGGALSQNRTLSVKYGTTAGTAVEGNDSRVVNALQKGNNLGDVPNKTLARQYLGLGSAATRNVGAESGNLMEVGEFGLGGKAGELASLNDIPPINHFGEITGNTEGEFPVNAGAYISLQRETTNDGWLLQGARSSSRWFLARHVSSEIVNTVEILHTGNMRSSTGNSTQYPMTQAAVTSALNTKADKSYVDTELGKKVNSSSVSAALADNTIPQRYNGGRVQVASPLSTWDATNKTYVDTQLGNLESAVTDQIIGVGQTWQDVTGSRAMGTTYTNSTGKPIMVNIYWGGIDGNFVSLYVDGVRVGGATSRNTASMASILVPSGSTYMATGKDFEIWAELL